MVETNKLSVWRTMVFILFLVGFTILYYRKWLTVDGPQSKSIVMLRHVITLIVFVGLINTFSASSDRVFKIVLLVFMICLFNIYNIHHALKKCKSVPQQYKLTLYVMVAIYTIGLAIVLNHANNYTLVSYFYEDDVKARHESVGKDGSSISFIKRDRLPRYCPDMSDGYDVTKEWVQLTPEEKNNCRVAHSADDDGKGARSDIYSDVYA